MRGEKHPSLVSPVESKKIAPTRCGSGLGPLSERRVPLRRFTRPREATGKHLPSLYLIALGFGRRTRQVPGRVATHPRAG